MRLYEIERNKTAEDPLTQQAKSKEEDAKKLRKAAKLQKIAKRISSSRQQYFKASMDK